MALESLKKQMEEMDSKILKIATEIEKKTKLISELEISYEKIATQLNNEKANFLSEIMERGIYKQGGRGFCLLS